MVKKTLFQLYIDPEQKEFIKKEAEKNNKSRAAVVREIIEEKMKKPLPNKR